GAHSKLDRRFRFGRCELQSNRYEPPPQGVLGGSWDDFVKSVVNGARKVANIVCQTAESVIHSITDDLGNLYTIVVDTVEIAASIVAGALKTVISDIIKAVEWLSSLFNWSQILTVKDELKGLLTQGTGN